MIVLMAGLPGTGKSTLAAELAAKTSGRVISKDEIRHAIFSAYEIEYSTRQDDFCLDAMMQIAGYLSRRDPARFIFLDGRPFSRRYQIENIVNAACSLHQPWRILECICNEETAQKRIAEQTSTGEHPAGNRDSKLYLEVKARFEAITFPKTVIDTEQSFDICVKQALAAFR